MFMKECKTSLDGDMSFTSNNANGDGGRKTPENRCLSNTCCNQLLVLLPKFSLEESDMPLNRGCDEE